MIRDHEEEKNLSILLREAGYQVQGLYVYRDGTSSRPFLTCIYDPPSAPEGGLVRPPEPQGGPQAGPVRQGRSGGPMSDGFCRNCGHSNHQDALQEDFCYKITPGPDGGLCGCQTWDEAFEEDYQDRQEERDYEEAQEGFLPAHAFGKEGGGGD